MTFAPGALFVNAMGCFLDWLITRVWGRVMLMAIPGSIGLSILVMSIWGSMLNKDKLAIWYVELGEKELDKIDGNWFFGGKTANANSVESGAASGSNAKVNSAKENSNAKEKQSDKNAAVDSENETNEDQTASSAKSESSSAGAAESSREDTIPRFAEAVFRRAQQLQPDNKRIIFVIAAMLSQRGSFAQAMAMLSPLAPDDKEGYAPAHALMANLILQQPIPPEKVEVLKHHIQIAPKWDRTPPGLLAVAAEFAVREKNSTRAMALLKQAAKELPVFYLEVLNLARSIGNAREAEQAAKKAEAYFRDLIAKGEDKPSDRLALAQVLATSDAPDEVIEEVTRMLEEGLQKQESPELRRGLSEIWRLKFSRTVTLTPGSTWSGQIPLLDHAMQIDPTNPGIAEEVAKLARIGGERPSDALMQKLKDILAQGVATPLTHVWLSEAHILRGEYKEAVFHLNTVIVRMPNAAAKYRNNLAFAMVLAFPDQLEQALEHANFAVAMEPRNADHHDTRGFVLLKLNRITEAITELELAVELAPQQKPPRPRPDFHQRLAEAYKLEGNQQMAEAHLKLADELSKTLMISPQTSSTSDNSATNSPADATVEATQERPPAPPVKTAAAAPDTPVEPVATSPQ